MVGELAVRDLTEFVPSTITQIYGEAASGKTNLCLIAAAETARRGKKVIYIDTEGSFSTQRFKQVAGADAVEFLKLISIAAPSDFDEQKIAINKTEDLAAQGGVGLVVVDSLVSLYRLEMGSQEASATNRELSKQLAKLMKIAKKHDVPVVVTNQVYATFSRDGEAQVNVVPVGRDVLKYWTKNVLHLTKDGPNRVATIIRHNFKPEGASVRFKITSDGINESLIDNTSGQV